MRSKLWMATAALVSATMIDYDSFDQISEDILSKRTDVYNVQWPESGIRVNGTTGGHGLRKVGTMGIRSNDMFHF